MELPSVSAIRIYPIKGLDFVELKEAEVGIHSLSHDRAYAMIAEDGRYINGKRTGLVNQLQAEYDIENGIVRLTKRGTNNWEEFELRADNEQLETYLSDFFSRKLHLVHSKRGELQDMPKTASVSVVSESTFKSLHQAFLEESLDQFRLRFRTNLEIRGVDAYWEESLFDEEHKGIQFKIGEVTFQATAPRARCNVPPKNPYTGELDKNFAHKMLHQREKTLPKSSHLPFFGNLYHLTLDTYVPKSEEGKTIRIGDVIRLFILSFVYMPLTI